MLFAFCRLRLPQKHKNTKTKKWRNKETEKQSLCKLLPQIENAALIRELHTYGYLVPVERRLKGASQHIGMGKRLMQEAEKIAHQNDYKKITVISGIGVRAYYRKLKYRLSGTYMVKHI